MSYILTDQLDRFGRTHEPLPYQRSIVTLTGSKAMLSTSTTKSFEAKGDGNMTVTNEFRPLLNEELENGGVHSKIIDNPIEIALRALVDENGLGNYSESGERAVSGFRLGL